MDPLGHIILNPSNPIVLVIVDCVSKKNMIILFSAIRKEIKKNFRARGGKVNLCISENAIIVLHRKLHLNLMQ